MSRNIGLSITGKNYMSSLSLKGCIYEKNNNLPLEVKNIKISIMSLIVIPYISEQWEKLEENMCFYEVLIKRINHYLSIYVDNDYLLLYKELLQAFETIITQRNELKHLEQKLLYNDESNVSSIIFKTTIVKLKPEVEIYNLVIGKPIKGQTYNKQILNKITQLLEIENITFDSIKKQITNLII